MKKTVRVGNIEIGNTSKPLFILGPCVIESRDHTLNMAKKLKELSIKLDFPFIFKTSFDKANRTSINSFRGPGLEEGLKVLEEVKKELDILVLTDVHTPDQPEIVAKVVDILQIPAFLCRQTDLILSAAKTGKPINIKKGQFISPHDVVHIIRKIESTGNNRILLTERGTCFGYRDLVVDFRSIKIMKKTNYPVIFDATHSVQVRGGEKTGGNREFIPTLAKASVAAGCDGLFFETHDNVEKALSDKDSQIPFSELTSLIQKLIQIYQIVRSDNSE